VVPNLREKACERLVTSICVEKSRVTVALVWISVALSKGNTVWVRTRGVDSTKNELTNGSAR